VRQVATSAKQGAVEVSPGPAPPPYEGTQDYVFISYKREEMSHVAPFLREIVNLGYNIWYDKGIPGGSDWLDLIYLKVKNCKSLVVFLSTAAVSSRYVRDEVQLAHKWRKPILPIRLDDVEIGGGLDFILSSIQTISTHSTDFSVELKNALDHINNT
jgi:hypothetical protein